MSDPENLVKIHIDLPGRKEIGGESLWAKPLGKGLYEIRNSPWYAYDIHWGDIVRAVSPGAGRKPEFKKVVKPSGHKTLRVRFAEGVDPEPILRKLQKMQASHEKAEDRFYAIDADPAADYEALRAYLRAQEQAGRLKYESGISTQGPDGDR